MKNILVADECWAALARLHQDHPERTAFSPREIIDRVTKDASEPVRRGIQPHVYQHNVANLKPSSARYRMFFRLPGGQLRLFRPGDSAHPDRKGKIRPDPEDLPEGLRGLINWYENEYCRRESVEGADPVLAMIGAGKELWADEDGDTFIRRERAEPAWRTRDELSLADEIWGRLARHEGQTFHTVTGLRFIYRTDGKGIRFVRDGKTVNRRLSRSDFDKAVSRIPLSRTTDLADCQGPAYLFALLTDDRIVHKTDLAA